VQQTLEEEAAPQEEEADMPQEEMPAEAPRKGLMARGAM
jgi:hypothetical protein